MVCQAILVEGDVRLAPRGTAEEVDGATACDFPEVAAIGSDRCDAVDHLVQPIDDGPAVTEGSSWA